MRGPAVVFTPDESGRTRTVTEAEFLAWAETLAPRSGLAVDTETTGLEWDAGVRTVQFGNSECGFAVDVAHVDGRELVQSALDLYRGPLIFHNSSFDIRRLEQVGVDSELVWPRAIDTHVMAHIINPDRLSFKLKQLARVELGDEST
jgi:ribonuclease D